MSSKIQVKRGTTAQWADSSTNDTTLAPGQLGIEYTTSGGSRVKVGQGTSTTDWSELDYLSPDSQVYKDSEINIKSETKLLLNVNFAPKSGGQLLGTSELPWYSLYTNSIMSSKISDNGTSLSPTANSIGSFKENTDRNQADSLGDIASTFDSICLSSNAKIYVNTNTDAQPVMRQLITVNSASLSESQGGKHSLNSGDILIGNYGSTGTFNSLIIASPSTTVYGYGRVDIRVGEVPLTLSGNSFYADTSYPIVSLGREEYPFLGVFSSIFNTYNGPLAALQLGGNETHSTSSTYYDVPVLTFTPTNSYVTSGNTYSATLISVNNNGYENALRGILKFGQGGTNATQLLGGMTGGVEVTYSGAFRATANGMLSCGDSRYKWTSVWSNSGTIQTSDRSMKSDIHYIDEPQIQTMSTRSVSSTSETLTTEDLITFIKALQPATFIYKKKDVETDTLQELSLNDALNENPENIQLGLIADDIKDNPIFKYVGVDYTSDSENTEDENTSHLGLQAIPLAVLALTACKNLLQRVEQLENK